MATSSFLIGATNSGAGKTTIMLGLLRALVNRGLNVQPFKCGPDYIDTQFHEVAAGKPSYNLDVFLSSREHVKNLFYHYSEGKNVSIVEGVMGLFDGYDKMKGSSAEIAALLNLPVILVINAKSMAYSAAAIIYGFKNFYPDVAVKGVIFNRVSSETHYKFLCEACEETGVIPLGYLPDKKELHIPSRHLGLNTDADFNGFAEKAAAVIEEYIDIEQLLDITSFSYLTQQIKREKKTILNIAIAKDEAFSFMYQDNLEKLKEWGTVTYFSPLHDKILPKADFIYIPGGYPELYLKELSENKKLFQQIREYVETGGRLWAECGGMMYLSSTIADKEGKEYPMADVFKQKASMQNMKLKLGYRQFKYKGISFKGHEFHYSRIESDLQSEVQQYSARGQEVDTKLLRYKNAIGSYTHLYWGDKDNFMDIFKI
ncbi:MAG: cobyrinate a,c-diamide synthase [Odoribacter sp.]|nr:cobyrinate a,c-diamide synthase [Odoribacter sp.]